VRTSYNGNIRGIYAGIGYFYDEASDVFVAPEIEVPANVVIVPPKDTDVEPIVIELFVRPALGIVATAVKGLVPLPTR
jgi:hypothetical protein